MPFPDANADEDDEIGGPGRVKRAVAAGANVIRNIIGVGPARANRPKRVRPPRARNRRN